MSEAIIHSMHVAERRSHESGFGSRLNRVLMGWMTRVEDALQRRRDRHLLASMSDGELADIGLGPGGTEQVFHASPEPR